MDQFISIISSPIFTSIIFVIKTIFILFSLILIVVIIILLVKTTWLRFRYFEDYTELIVSRPYGAKVKFRKMESISKKMESNDERDYKLGVIEAEEFLKEVLEKMGYKGSMLKDMLDQVDEKVMPSIRKVKEAQSIRNMIIHNPDYHLTQDQAKNIVKIYEQALNELEAL